MTSEQTSYCKVKAFERAMFPECLKGILRAGRGESAAWLLERRYAYLIEPYQENERRDRDLL
jgi:hypothetical protein